MPQINVILTIAADAVSGTRDVTVTTSAGNINVSNESATLPTLNPNATESSQSSR